MEIQSYRGKIKLDEASRRQLISKSKSSQKGLQRYKRRNRSKIMNTVKQYNEIDMDKLFKKNILTVGVQVQGETDKYIVTISFGGFLDVLYDQIKTKGKDVELKDIIKSLNICLNREDVYIRCTCDDFKYRHAFQASKNNYIVGSPERRPSRITNPYDKLGSGCKHILLVLGNSSWIVKVASVINNYIKYMKDHYEKLYANVIYPAIYKKDYEDDVQMNIFDNDDDTLSTDKDTIDTANKYGKERTQFKQGNKQGIRFTSNNKDKDQLEFDFDNEGNQS